MSEVRGGLHEVRPSPQREGGQDAEAQVQAVRAHLLREERQRRRGKQMKVIIRKYLNYGFWEIEAHEDGFFNTGATLIPLHKGDKFQLHNKYFGLNSFEIVSGFKENG